MRGIRFGLALTIGSLLCVGTAAPAVGQDLAEQLRQGLEKRKAEQQASSTSTEQSASAKSGSTSPASIMGIPIPDLSPLFAEPQSDDEPEQGQMLKRAAEWAFRAGDQKTARQLMFAHMAAEFEHAKPLIRSVRYSPLLKRPVWDIRFGASLMVRDGTSDGADPNPIPATNAPRRAVANRLGGRNGVRSAGRKQKSMADELAEALNRSQPRAARRSNQRKPSSQSAPAGQQADKKNDSPTDSIADRLNPNSSGKTPLAATPDKREMLDAKAEAELLRYLGLVAEIMGAEFVTRHQRGDFGSLLAEIESQEGDPDANDGSEKQSASAVPLDDDALPMWKPGIVYLGQGNKNTLMEKARAAGIDILVSFEVQLRPNRGGKTQNISRCRLIDVRSGDYIGRSRPIDSLYALQGGDSTDEQYVRGQLQNLLEILDSEVKVIKLPELSAEIAKTRVGRLLDGPPRALRTLAEIRLYQLQNLLTTEEVEQAFSIVGGAEALTLLYGSPTERSRLARRWVTESEAAERRKA